MKKVILLFSFLLFLLTNLFSLNISVFTLQQQNEPSVNNRDYKWIKDNFDVTFKWDILHGDKDQKIAWFIKTKKLPDLVEVDSTLFQDNGLLIDLKPLIEQYCPNLKKHYESVWNQMVYIDSEKDSNGDVVQAHIYSLPDYGVYDGENQSTYYNQSAFWIQKRVLEEFNYPEIKTVEQYFDILKRYTKKHPLTYGSPTLPFTILTDSWEAFNLWNPPSYLAGYPNDGNGHVDEVDGKYVYKDNFADENTKRWFKLLNKYYHNGLVDPASFTDSRDEYFQKISEGRVLGMFIQGWEFMYGPEYELRVKGQFDKTYVPLPIVFDKSITPHYRSLDIPNLQRGYGITVNCGEKKAIEILKFFDAMLEEENQKRLFWGIEGIDYLIDETGKITGKKGAPYRTQQQKRNQENPSWRDDNLTVLFRDKAPKLEGTYSDGYPTDLNYLMWENTNLDDTDKKILKAYKVNSYAELMGKNPPPNECWFPMWQCSPSYYDVDATSREAFNAMTNYELYQRKYLPMLVMCNSKDFEEIWNEYEKYMKPLTSKYCKYMQQQLDARVKHFKNTDY